MKNIITLISKEQTHKFFLDLWKSDLFLKSHESHGYVYNLIEKFAHSPKFIFEMSNLFLEKAHFSAWWGGIPYRDYDNPYIHDLYWLHETCHAGEMVYFPDLEFPTFKEKLFSNEMLASVHSELLIYFIMPELRSKTFSHEILVDRILFDPTFHQFWKTNPSNFTELLKVWRKNIMISKPPSHDKVLYWIHKFSAQNDAWGSVWFNEYNTIETQMFNMQKESVQDREASITKHIAWLNSKSTDSIPFLLEAEAFAGIYWSNIKRYDLFTNPIT